MMSDKTVTLSREPVAWANWKVGTRSYVPYRTREQAEACVRASEIAATQLGPYRVVPLYADPAEPMPPAGGDPEVLGYRVARIKPTGNARLDRPLLSLVLDGWEPAFKAVPLVDRAHVTRLQAEVERWKGRTTNICQARSDLQSELTKALELLKKARWRLANTSRAPVPFDDPLDGPVLRGIDEFLANQSAPAAKDGE
jgi:hypothetical protein